ncbi:unnamed protein product [Cylindrotheca closterium]|uniref:Uncharacterized protein n=1 Tax=Cylindrotheca closterium TaxID=2856 RepID=A0AAD2D0J2_9STRA|nr:unnamed protein product [Cylindrotheca closterium]
MATLTIAPIAPPEPSSAERSVREVASRLGIPNVEHVIQLMKQEYVVTDWQLSALDSFQWKSLGAPIGLAVAVHQIIQQEQQPQYQQKPYVLPSDKTTESTKASKIFQDLDQHNINIVESASHSSIDGEEKEEGVDTEENNCTVVDAATIQETSMDDEPEQDENLQNSTDGEEKEESVDTEENNCTVVDAAIIQETSMDKELEQEESRQSSTDGEEKEESVDTEENNYTVVDAATIQETTIDKEPEQDENFQNSESILADAFETDAASKEEEEEDVLAKESSLNHGTDDKQSSSEQDPDEADVAAATSEEKSPIKATVSIDSPPRPQEPEVCDADTNSTNADMNNATSSLEHVSDKVVEMDSPVPSEEPEVCETDAPTTDADTNTQSPSLESMNDKAIALAATLDHAPGEDQTLPSNNRAVEELVVKGESGPDAASNDESVAPESVANDESVGPQNLPDVYDDNNIEPAAAEPNTAVEEESTDFIVKSPSEDSSEGLDADDVDTIPTTSMSEEESMLEYKSSSAVSSPPTTLLSAPLPHDECDDSFHVSDSKRELLLLKPSFDSEDISEDLLSFAGNEDTGGTKEDDEENKDQSKPRLIHERIDSFGGDNNDEDDMDNTKEEDHENKEDLAPRSIQDENSVDPVSFAASQEEMDRNTKGVGEENNEHEFEPGFIQEENSEDLDSFDNNSEDDTDEGEESLDNDDEDDIFISGQDLLVDLSSGETQEDDNSTKQQRSTAENPFDMISFGQFRTSPQVDPNSVTLAEFRTTGSSDLDDEDGYDDPEGRKTATIGDPSSLSQPFVMHKRTVSSLESLYYVDNDECTVVASNVSPERRNRPKRRRSLEDSADHTIQTLSHVSSFDVEWDEFCLVLHKVPSSKTQRTILSQLLIMTNGRTKPARYKMAKQVSQMILKSLGRSEDGEEERKVQTAQLRSNLQLFAKLHRAERKVLGKKIFEQISKLYAGGDDDNKKSGQNLSSNVATVATEGEEVVLDDDDEQAAEMQS